MRDYKEILKNWRLPEGKSTEQAWAELEPKLVNTTTGKGKVVPFNWKPLVAITSAAAAVVIAIIFIWPANDLIQHQTLAGQMETIQLPDNSKVILNANSSLTYSSDWSSERKLNLSGEAFFEVEKGNTFKVVSEQGIVTVLGTSFNVFTRKEKFEVICSTGKVGVQAGNNQTEIGPGGCVQLMNGELKFENVDTQQSGWVQGEFIYTAEPLQNVVLELERQYGVSIKCPDISERVYSGYFNNKNLNEALNLVFTPMQLAYTINADNTIVVTNMK
jgi:transmembrane sensor